MPHTEQNPQEPQTTPLTTRVVRIRLTKGRVAESNVTVLMLWGITLLFVAFGLIMVLSASSITSYLNGAGFLGGFQRQALYALFGLLLMIIASRIPLWFWKKWAWGFFGLGLVLQMLVFTPLGFEVGGNRNWVRITETIGLQPSEFLKLAMIVWMSTVLQFKEKLIAKPIHALIPAVIPGAVLAVATVLFGGDLGTAMVMFAIVIGVLIFADIDWKTIGLVVAAAVAAALLFLVTSENRMRRLMGLVSNEEDYSGHDWQPLHGIWALAGGEMFGSGLGSSKAKWSWLPAADNDYIFAIIGEEFGFVGAVATMLLYVGLAYLLFKVIGMSRDRFGKGVVGGVLVWIVGQALLNIGVVVRLLPVIGVPLPLISSGGTALVATLIAMGVVLSIARDGAQYQEELRTGTVQTKGTGA
ncbi:cell division protein FtsW [Leucobacter sp. UCMA 4100]|uniref:FtsW/RodA/SpoVE family cell cycle protein n=1 Tax=Leucobacter sp. UCMA 4100 TaxID=2810534 RepID=UPI0022EA3E9D|nr:putative peptidoglycan glycosyltransferase FtsW [Leucobacter sp. UCMA 4100]MDA3148107.1 cell division protein FtsW [Leucobacter sp. UCMA 4100]